jgi:hypothetical protein
MRKIDRRLFLGSSIFGMAAIAGGNLIWAGAQEENAARPDTLFLTWQRDPTTTMTVQWIAKQRDAKVEFATWGDVTPTWQAIPCTTRPYPMTESHTFRAELTGLKPATEYQFRIDGSPAAYRFRTMPAKATEAIRFVSGGDCGVDLHAVNNNMQAAKQDPMFVVIDGDLGYDNGISADTSIRFLRNYSKHLVDSQGRLIPLVVGIGNHEIVGGYGGARSAAPFFFALHDGLYPETSYNVLDFGDYMSIVLLDTGHQSPIGGEQTSWLEKTLAARVDCPNLLVFNHVPAYPSYRPFSKNDGTPGTGADNRKHWLPLFERYNVDVVFEHHDHTFKRTKPMLGGHVDERRGLIYLGDGSWGKIRPIIEPEKRPYLAAYNSAYHMSLHEIEGSKRRHQAIDEYGKVIDVCMTDKRPQTKVG